MSRKGTLLSVGIRESFMEEAACNYMDSEARGRFRLMEMKWGDRLQIPDIRHRPDLCVHRLLGLQTRTPVSL